MRAVVEATRPVWELLRDLALVPWRPVQAVLGEDAEDVAANLAQTAAAFREAAERARAAARRAREVSVLPLRVSSGVRCPFGALRPGLDGDGEDAEPDLEACAFPTRARGRRSSSSPGSSGGRPRPGRPRRRTTARRRAAPAAQRRTRRGRRRRRGGRAGGGPGDEISTPKLLGSVHFMQPWNQATPQSVSLPYAAASELAAFRGPKLRPLPARPALHPPTRLVSSAPGQDTRAGVSPPSRATSRSVLRSIS